MNFVELSIRRPIFITCLVLVMLAVGWRSMQGLGVDLFPNVTFPVVTVSTPYPGASPNEIETLVSKPIEDEVSTISGLKRLSSINKEGVSVVVAEFTLETDVKYAEQQIRDRVSSAKTKLPKDIDEPIIRRIDPSDQPVITISLEADLKDQELFELADKVIRPKIEQVNQVGLVEIIGGREREIHVELDRQKLKSFEISASQVATRLSSAGENVPVGKVSAGASETVFRALGQFAHIDDIKSTIVNFFGSDVPVTIADIGTVTDTVKDESSRAFVNGKKSVFINVFRQSGSNTIAVVNNVLKRMDKINVEVKDQPGSPKLRTIRNAAVWIENNVKDVEESIMYGIILAVLVVYFFLANGRSTIITGLALPNSLIGAFVLMAAAGFTINIMTLLALSLSVGLLIDDAIVVRENIFRHIENGEEPITAARNGTKEVQLAVIATTFTVLAVFGPVGFLKGVVGQFFKEFGLTICFAMMISLFDALTVAPMLSAYFASHKTKRTGGLWYNTVGRAVRGFGRFQDWLEAKYMNVLKFTLRRPLFVLGMSFLVFLGSCSTVIFVPKTFLPTQDAGEFQITFDLPPGSSLDNTHKVGIEIDRIIHENKAVELSAMTIGDRDGQANVGDFYIKLVPSHQRRGINTSKVKQDLRDALKPMMKYTPVVKDYDAVGGGQRPFQMNIIGDDQKLLEEYGLKMLERARANKGLKDVDVNFRVGKPEFQIAIDKNRADKLGVSTVQAGMELRTQIEGLTPAKFREHGEEYDVRVRLRADQRDLKGNFEKTYVPNINFNLVRLRDVATAIDTQGPSRINRQDRSRYVQIQADIAPGAGMGDVMNELTKDMTTPGEFKLPDGMRYGFVGQAENFQELNDSMGTAMMFGVLFIFLVLASLYESFVTPFTIMLALPLAICGSTVALALTGESLNIFSMIGMIMLLGVATKNSILLVDYAHHLVKNGTSRYDAMMAAGKTRLRPILMTTMALIAGTLPVAIGLNEAAKQRTSMGVAIIGGLVSSTLLTLIVVPAAYSYVDRFRVWSKGVLGRVVGSHPSVPHGDA